MRITRHARVLSGQMQALSATLFPPSSKKILRSFSSGEVARFLGVSDGYLRQLSLDGLGPSPALSAAGGARIRRRRSASFELIWRVRVLKRRCPSCRRRRPGDKLQIVAVANFKGGSAKTTTALYVTQFLALEGYRVLAIDLDPQASLSAMFGYQPEFDIGEGETLYGAIRYDDARRPMREVVRPTYFTGVSLIPGNLELMEFEHHTPRAMVERIIARQ